MSFLLVGAAAVSAVSGIAKSRAAKKAQKKAEREAAIAKAEMDKQKAAFSALDTSNPYLNMENTMEDLTVNQQQAQFEAQQNQQQQANIMSGLRGAAGGSGIAALAQTMAQQGQLASQKASATIGQQEADNQKLAAQEASRLQGMEREGEVLSREMERNKVSTLLGMAQGETAGFRQQAAAAEAAKMEGYGQIASGVTTGLTALSDRRLKKNIKAIGKSPSGLNIYTFEYINKDYGKGVFQGAMSDDVPSNVVLKSNEGYDMIDYSKIDIEFKNIS